jgi:glycosyltransferase involved in cell wall biosynthesis
LRKKLGSFTGCLLLVHQNTRIVCCYTPTGADIRARPPAKIPKPPNRRKERPLSVSVLIPTYERPESLVMTLSGVASQTLRDLQVVVASQGRHVAAESPVARALGRVIEARGGTVEWHHRERELGIAEQRHFLLSRARHEPALFLDDDILMEPPVVERLLSVLEGEQCGFVGAFPAGLTFRDDVRPEQQEMDLWHGPVRPEVVGKDTPEWERWNLHRAANLYHVAEKLDLPPGGFLRYKVAWISSCVLYSRKKLLSVGGFSFWKRLPRYHKGEEVLVQNLLMRRYGGCGIVPSGTYHAEVETTTLSPDTPEAEPVDAFDLLLPELVERYAS